MPLTETIDPAHQAVLSAFIEGREHEPVGAGDQRLACWRTDKGILLLGSGDGVRLAAGTANGTLAVRAGNDAVTGALMQSFADGDWDPDGHYPQATLVCTDDALLDLLDDAADGANAPYPVADSPQRRQLASRPGA